jgi:hypothetical protein
VEELSCDLFSGFIQQCIAEKERGRIGWVGGGGPCAHPSGGVLLSPRWLAHTPLLPALLSVCVWGMVCLARVEASAGEAAAGAGVTPGPSSETVAAADTTPSGLPLMLAFSNRYPPSLWQDALVFFASAGR